MTNVTRLHINRLSEALHELLKRAERGEITFIEGLAQVDLGEHVEWKVFSEGDKSYDQQHMINQLGYYELLKQQTIEDICEGEDED
jgi:hypothetical protein